VFSLQYVRQGFHVDKAIYIVLTVTLYAAGTPESSWGAVSDNTFYHCTDKAMCKDDSFWDELSVTPWGTGPAAVTVVRASNPKYGGVVALDQCALDDLQHKARYEFSWGDDGLFIGPPDLDPIDLDPTDDYKAERAAVAARAEEAAEKETEAADTEVEESDAEEEEAADTEVEESDAEEEEAADTEVEESDAEEEAQEVLTAPPRSASCKRSRQADAAAQVEAGVTCKRIRARVAI
jgi:hypothetical protein